MIPLAFALILSWQDRSLVEDGYYVLKQVQPSKSFTYVKTLPADATNWIDVNVKRNQRICYMVTPFKGEEREYSNVACQRVR